MVADMEVDMVHGHGGGHDCRHGGHQIFFEPNFFDTKLFLSWSLPRLAHLLSFASLFPIKSQNSLNANSLLMQNENDISQETWFYQHRQISIKQKQHCAVLHLPSSILLLAKIFIDWEIAWLEFHRIFSRYWILKKTTTLKTLSKTIRWDNARL